MANQQMDYANMTDEQWDALADKLRAESVARRDEEPRVLSATYQEGMLEFVFGGAAVKGATASVPAQSLRALENGNDTQLAAMKVVSDGASVHWPDLDVQLSSVALLQVVFGLRTLKANVAKAGATRTAAKSEAARLNGAKGGRPRKVPV